MNRDTASPLLAFSVRMNRKLQANNHKGGWNQDSIFHLRFRICEELVELFEALDEHADPEEIADEAADVANFAMMIADNVTRK